ncbi:MAG: sulfite exporter TauE/SafE family protein [Candidatus Omnitrophica bacterium]|nr:sulfite exporter TauE/SafE family protein [Candidatus Omnitrophota bacterium]
MMRTALGLFILGLSFGSGPCLVSCGPVLITYLAGTKRNILKGLSAYVLFSSVRMLTYIILGLGIFFLGRIVLGRFLSAISKYIFIFGGGFIVLLGLFMASGRQGKYDRKNIVIMGLVIGFLPCVPLIAIFTYIALVSKSWLQSLFYLFSFGIGTSISPLIFLVILTGLIPRLFEKKTSYVRIFNLVCGLIIVFLGFGLIRRAF